MKKGPPRQGRPLAHNGWSVSPSRHVPELEALLDALHPFAQPVEADLLLGIASRRLIPK
jgi:hypothetical protein